MKLSLYITTVVLIVLLILFHLNFFDLWQISPETIEDYVKGFGFWGPVILIGLYIFTAVFMLPVLPLTVAGGVLFGFVPGSLYSMIGMIIGSALVFFSARSFASIPIKNFLLKYTEKFYYYYQKLGQSGFPAVFVSRLIPVAPFNILTLVLALTSIRSKDFVYGTIVGVFPATLLYSYVGLSLMTFDVLQIIFAFLLLKLFLILVYKYRKEVFKL